MKNEYAHNEMLRRRQKRFQDEKNKSNPKTLGESNDLTFIEGKIKEVAAKNKSDFPDEKVDVVKDFITSWNKSEKYNDRKPFLSELDWNSFKEIIYSVGSQLVRDDEDFEIKEYEEKAYRILSYYFTCNKKFLGDIKLKKNFNLNKGLIVFGPLGVGKTMAMRIMNEIAKHFKNPIAFDIEDSARNIPIDFSAEGGIVIKRFSNRKNVYINDWGLEPLLANWYSMKLNCIDAILYARHDLNQRRGYRTFLCTNLIPVSTDEDERLKAAEKMYEMYDKRTIQRLFHDSNFVAYPGENRRNK